MSEFQSQNPAPSVPRRRDGIETHLMPDGSALLFDPMTGEGHVLSAIGSFIWEYCDGTLTPDQIAAELAAVLPAVPDMRDEALRMIAEFAAAGLLTSSPPAAAAGSRENALP